MYNNREMCVTSPHLMRNNVTGSGLVAGYIIGIRSRGNPDIKYVSRPN